MEVEKIVSTVQEQVGNTDFSAQTIQKAIELFPVAEGQEPDEAYFSKVASFIKGMQGQYNHDFSTKFKEAQKNLLTKDTIKNMSDEQIAEIKKAVADLEKDRLEIYTAYYEKFRRGMNPQAIADQLTKYPGTFWEAWDINTEMISVSVTMESKKKDDTISMDIVSIEKWIGISRIKRMYRNHIIKQHNRVIFYD